jgi:hypothetical protein
VFILFFGVYCLLSDVRTMELLTASASGNGITLSAIVAIAAALFSIHFFVENAVLSRQLADRTVTIEAQKLLLEINKQLISDPSLFAIYGENDELHRLISKIAHASRPVGEQGAPDTKLAGDPNWTAAGKLAGLGFMLLNVFEIVFAQMPPGSELDTWKQYFEDTLNRCPMISKLLTLTEAKVIYHRRLMESYDDWLRKQKAARTSFTQPVL